MGHSTICREGFAREKKLKWVSISAHTLMVVLNDTRKGGLVISVHQREEARMARIRIEGTKLHSWQEVDQALREIGEAQFEIERIEADLNGRIDKLKAEATKKISPIAQRKALKELAIQQFTIENREAMEAKTKILTFGQVGFRRSTKLIVRKTQEVIRRLRDLGLKDCIRVKESVDREALKQKGDAILEAVGVIKKTEDVFWYEVDREKIEVPT